jgi:hypothetical protein
MHMEPPWAQFPDYEHLCLGWRMGAGEPYLSAWWDHVATVPLADREAYLRQHPPAPHTWYKAVWSVLGSEEVPEADGLRQLVDRGLVASDIAYRTWTRDGAWPWDLASSLPDAARYETRRFAFLSRAMADDPRRTDVPIPPAWHAATQALRTGDPGPLNPQHGLHTLALLLCAGTVVGPWTLGLQVADVQDDFEPDMNYADAFRLWMMAVFDDRPHYEREVERLAPPPAWRRWMDDDTFLPADP